MKDKLAEIGRRVMALFHRDQFDADLEEEMRLHQELRAQEQVERGVSPEEARYAAQRRFGNKLVLREESRDTWGWNWLETFAQDVGYGLRQLRRNPGFTTVAMLTLALGIGANTAIFSLIDAVMLRTLPVQNPKQLVFLNWNAPAQSSLPAVESDSGASNEAPFSYPAFKELREYNKVFSSLFGFVSLGTSEVAINGQASFAQGEMVTGGYFQGLGVSPIMGRAIAEGDEKPGDFHAAVISYGYWSRALGRDETVLGKSITVDGVPFTVVGVAPPGFFGVRPGRAVDIWVPLINNPKLLPFGMDSTPGDRSLLTSRDWWWLEIMGRLRPGVTAQEATAQAEVLFRESITAGLKTPPRPQSIPRIQLEAASRGLANLRQQFSEPLWILMILVGVVLLIACVNVAGLLVARSATRQKEIAVRLSLGGSRRRIVRQLLTESILLAGIGGALGLLCAYWGSHGLVLLMSSGRQPLHLQVHLDARVLVFAAVVSLLVGILFGLAPALRSTRADLTPSLKAGTVGSAASQRTRLGFGKSLVVAEVALSLVLLIGAGLFVRTLVELEDQNLGFNQHHLLLFAMDPTTHGYKGERLIEFYGELLHRLQALPGIRSATASEMTLLSGWHNRGPVSVVGRKQKSGHLLRADFNYVGPSFFETMGIRLLLGRGVEWRDTASAPKVAVVNQAFARLFLDSGDPVGHSFRFGYYNFKAGQFSPSYEIVGLVRDAKYGSVRSAPPPTIYLPYSQTPYPLGGIHFEVRAAGDPLALVPTVRRVVHELDPQVPVAQFKTQTEQIGETLVQERLFARLSSFFGGLAVLLACIGLYGLMAYAVACRTNEIGIPMALGARPHDISEMILRETLAMTALGVAIGIPIALVASRLISSFLYGVKSSNPLTIVLAAVVMAVVTALAGYLPARRAAKVNPMAALRVC